MRFNRSKPMILRWIDHYIDGPFRQARIHWEGVAKATLDSAYLKNGSGLTKETLAAFCNAFDTEYIQAMAQPNPSLTRFGVARSSTLQVAKQDSNFKAFNEWARSLWTGRKPTPEVLGLLYDGYKMRRIKNARIFLFSMLLYLNAPEQFSVCTDNLAIGLTELSDGKSLKQTIKSGEDYAEYNAAALELRRAFKLHHVEADFIIFMGNPVFRAGIAAKGFPV